jgi:hypothetical protein
MCHSIFTHYDHYDFGVSNTIDSGQFRDIPRHIYKLRQMTWRNSRQIAHNPELRKKYGIFARVILKLRQDTKRNSQPMRRWVSSTNLHKSRSNGKLIYA